MSQYLHLKNRKNSQERIPKNAFKEETEITRIIREETTTTIIVAKIQTPTTMKAIITGTTGAQIIEIEIRQEITRDLEMIMDIVRNLIEGMIQIIVQEKRNRRKLQERIVILLWSQLLRRIKARKQDMCKKNDVYNYQALANKKDINLMD